MNNSELIVTGDKILVNRILSGDRDAFAVLIRQTEALITQIIFSMVMNPADRKDLVQDVYLNVFQGLGKFQFRSKLSTWIAQVAYNACYTYLRKRKLVLEDPADDTSNSLTAISESPEQAFHNKHLTAIFKNAVDQLPPLYKTIFKLYHSEEQSYLDIAAITGLPEGTVKSYLFRARKRLKENISLTYKKEEL